MDAKILIFNNVSLVSAYKSRITESRRLHKKQQLIYQVLPPEYFIMTVLLTVLHHCGLHGPHLFVLYNKKSLENVKVHVNKLY